MMTDFEYNFETFHEVFPLSYCVNLNTMTHPQDAGGGTRDREMNEALSNENPESSTDGTTSMDNRAILYDPGDFGRALRERDHSDRIQQDTGFDGQYFGWERGSRLDDERLSETHVQWRGIQQARSSSSSIFENKTTNASTAKLDKKVTYESGLDLKDTQRSIHPAGREDVTGLTRTPGNIDSSCDPSSDICHGSAAAQQVQVAPGVYEVLRDASETWKAIQEDYYMPCICLHCRDQSLSNIFTIQDARYVLCPHCKMVSPIENTYGEQTTPAYGIGFGFTLEELVKCQIEITKTAPDTFLNF